MYNVDLTNCDREPIHIPGKIQSHGFLIALSSEHTIVWCSENTIDFLSVPAVELLENHISILDEYVGKVKDSAFVVQLIQLYTTKKGFEPANPYALDIAGHPFNLIICKSGDGYLLEFEPEISDLINDLKHDLGSSLSEILGDSDLPSLVSNAAEQIKKIIGYDRVMVYRFHEDDHGEVIAEVKNDDLEPFLHLHYPASDIPKQARELYIRNHTRIISDVNSVSSDILTFTQSPTPLDLTDSCLRAVSPIHIQYLKNMGVASSFSISLIDQGKLWGLIACHNYTPRFINYKQRIEAKLISRVLSSAINYRQLEADQLRVANLQAAVGVLSKHLLRNNTVDNALFEHEVKIIDVAEASGAVLFFDNQIYKSGITPDNEFLTTLVTWLNEYVEPDVFVTDHLPAQNPLAIPYKDSASGILVCRLSKELSEYMIWFKPERISTIHWAGNPDKPVEVDQHGIGHLSPRESFAKWSQLIEMTSEPWKKADVKSAMLLMEEVVFAISRKATEIRILNERIKTAYEELDAFSYTISHDLKNPISSIKGYSQLLVRNQSLDEKAINMVKRIEAGADKMKGMIGDVLHYSLVSKAKKKAATVDMAKLLNDLKEELIAGNIETVLKIDIVKTIDIVGDETMIMQVFSNLLSNAVKYSKTSSFPLITIDCENTEDGVQYSVTDNGIGIDPEDHDRIFELFRRSERVKDYEGSGVGLSIVRRIIEKHNGKIWLESEPGKGSTFYLKFKNDLQEVL